MHCDEKKQICLNYASNVPEWQLGLTLGALADIGEAVSTLGKAMYALEVVLTQSSLFPTAKDLAIAADAAYNVQHLSLQNRCRVHGCPEVAYKHG